jgi:hypothetical protein
MKSFPDWAVNRWCLYDAMNGATYLKHPYTHGLKIPCPHCGKALRIDAYQSTCCDQEFKIGFGAISQRAPIGKHTKTAGRGWQGLRLFDPS